MARYLLYFNFVKTNKKTLPIEQNCHISPINSLPQDRYSCIMKFVVSSEELLKHLIATGRIIPGANKEPDNFADLEVILSSASVVEDYAATCRSAVASRIEELFSASTRELMRRLAKYTDQKVSTQFLRLRKSFFRSITLLFGLCCSSSTYIFNAIFGVHATRIPSILPVLS